MELFLVALLSGMLTVLTPCVLPVLPVVLGGSLSGSSKWRPLVISFSLVVSIFIFTLVLKASTALIEVPPSFWTSVSGVIVLIFGLSLVFPGAWSAVAQKLGFTKSEGLLQKAAQKEGLKGMVLLGFALGPVFASCSPTYALILAVVLPTHFSMGLWALVAYCIGLLIPLLLIGYGGRRILGGFRWFADPTSWFRKGLGVLLIVVAVLILTGYEKKLEAAILDNGYIDFTKVEQTLLEKFGTFDDMEKDLLQIEPSNEDDSKHPTEALLNVNYAAPELTGVENWINSEALTLAQLAQEDKVVVIDFWTYSCINCIRTLPALRALDEKYSDDGLVIIGVHSPEFAFEQKLENLQREVNDFQLKYPVVQDNDFATWRAYKNRFWPAKYIIDKEGNVRYTHFGEGAYEETEEVIQYLLGMEGDDETIDFDFIDSSQGGVRTGETYLGTGRHVLLGSDEANSEDNRQAVFVSPEEVSSDGVLFSSPGETSVNQWWLMGEWVFDDEKIVSLSETASIHLVYEASAANLVMGVSEAAVNVEILLDGEVIDEADQGDYVLEGGLFLSEPELYYLSEHDEVEQHEIELRFDGPGVELYAWTFG